MLRTVVLTRSTSLLSPAYGDAYVVEGGEPLDVVLEHMATNHIGSALVTKDGLLMGILTATDACRLFCDLLRKTHSGDPAADSA